jgi:hypothetical protein
VSGNGEAGVNLSIILNHDVKFSEAKIMDGESMSFIEHMPAIKIAGQFCLPVPVCNIIEDNGFSLFSSTSAGRDGPYDDDATPLSKRSAAIYYKFVCVSVCLCIFVIIIIKWYWRWLQLPQFLRHSG